MFPVKQMRVICCSKLIKKKYMMVVQLFFKSRIVGMLRQNGFKRDGFLLNCKWYRCVWVGVNFPAQVSKKLNNFKVGGKMVRAINDRVWVS